MIEIKNAIITRATITNERGFILSAWLNLEYGDGMSQCFGGYSLYLSKESSHHNSCLMGPNIAGLFIYKVMEIADVEYWDRVPSKTIRVKCDWNKVYAIGHITKDIWFDPAKEFESLRKEG